MVEEQRRGSHAGGLLLRDGIFTWRLAEGMVSFGPLGKGKAKSKAWREVNAERNKSQPHLL